MGEAQMDRLRDAHRRLAEGNREVRRLLEGIDSGPVLSASAPGPRSAYSAGRYSSTSAGSSVGPRYSASPDYLSSRSPGYSGTPQRGWAAPESGRGLGGEHARRGYGGDPRGGASPAPVVPPPLPGGEPSDPVWRSLLRDADNLSDSPRRRWQESPERDHYGRDRRSGARTADGAARGSLQPCNDADQRTYTRMTEREIERKDGVSWPSHDRDFAALCPDPERGAAPYARRYENRYDYLGADAMRGKHQQHDPPSTEGVYAKGEHEAARLAQQQSGVCRGAGSPSRASIGASPRLRRLAQDADSRYAHAEDAVEAVREASPGRWRGGAGSPGRWSSVSAGSAVGPPHDVIGEAEVAVPIDVDCPRRGARYSDTFRTGRLTYRLKWYEAGDNGDEDAISLYFCPIEGHPRSVTVDCMLDGRLCRTVTLGAPDLAEQPPCSDGRDGVGWGALLGHSEIGRSRLSFRVAAR